MVDEVTLRVGHHDAQALNLGRQIIRWLQNPTAAHLEIPINSRLGMTRVYVPTVGWRMKRFKAFKVKKNAY